jgi:toxin ParE1/3/4
MNHLRVSDQAKIDLIEIFAYREGAASLTVADHIVENIEEHFQLLAQFPDIGRKCPEIAPGAMRFPTEKYLIYYRKGPE